LGLGYTAFYGDPAGFGNTLTTGGRWDLVVIEHASFFELGQWWSEVESYVQQGDTYSSAPSTSMARTASPRRSGHARVTPGASLSQAIPVYWWAPRIAVQHPAERAAVHHMQNLYTDSGDNVG